MITIGFDPALHDVGVAVFHDGVLVDAYTTSFPGGGRGPAAWGRVAFRVWAPLLDQLADAPHPAGAITVIIEDQVVYPHSHADPNAILQVSGVAGGLAAIAAGLGATVVGVEPSAWKGQAPKQVVANRSKDKLTQREKQAVRPGTTLDGWDAIGLCLWYFKRGIK